MKIHNVSQGSVEWHQLRAGIPTASEFDALITPLGKIKTGEGPKTYLAKKLAQWWLGGPLSTEMSSFAMDQGSFMEDFCIPWYELEYETKIQRVGFITTDDVDAGCSPDGLLGDDGGLELKAPQIETHIGYLLGGVVPSDYIAQVQGSMFVTGRKWWKFVSYRRKLPALVLHVDIDDDFQEALYEALSDFSDRFEAGKQRLVDLNGGPPKRAVYQAPQPQPEFVSEMPS